MTVGVVVPAAGSGTRLGPGLPKALRPLGGATGLAPMVIHAVRSLLQCSAVGPVVIVLPEDHLGALADWAELPGLLLIPGGAERSDSVRAGLAALPDHVDRVLVHDAARPFPPRWLVQSVVDALDAGAQAVVPVLPITDTVKRVRDGQVVETLPREELRAVQTPQGFLRAVLEEAHRSGTEVTDDATLVERRGVTVVTVPGSAAAFKVTVAADLWLAEAYVTGRTPPGWGMPPDWEAPPDRPLPDGHRRVAG